MSFTFLFLPDVQLGCYATFSGKGDQQIESFAARDMKVRAVPETQSWEWDASRFRDTIDVANDVEPAFIILGGDMIEDLDEPGQLETFEAITAGLDPSIPIHYIPGNHDIATDAVNPTPESIAFYREAFGEPYTAFDHEGASFILIDSVLIDRPASAQEEYGAQMVWLEDALRSADHTPGPTVVFSHHPLFVSDPDEADTYWNLSRERRRVLLDLLEDHNVDTVFSGHRHRNEHTTYKGIELVTSSAVGYPLGDDPSGYRVVEVSEEGITHRYRGLERQGWE